MTSSIRLATPADLPAINDIYNYYVLNSTCTYQLDPSTPAQREAWFAHHCPTLPVTVAEIPAPPGIQAPPTLVGWASLSYFHERPAYRFTVENSLYVHHAFHRRGIGGALLADLIRRADDLGYRNIIANIDADQTPSIALHRAFGFTQVGHLPRVGYKFDRWLGIVFLQREHPQ